MDSLIKLLPDHIANQIAAGEVIQRPASVVKELVENAIDAGATEIQILIKDAGKTLIQVIDNGKGMASMDARMAFERHATSKIRSADDLFRLTTLGFRGEALPSIAAVSQVTLQTRTSDSESGLKLVIEGSRERSSESIVCAIGSNFSVRNLFYNVPARRKFLKTENTEFRHILNEVRNVAAVRPAVAFSLTHNDQEVLRLVPSSLRERIVRLFGPSRLNNSLVPVEVETEFLLLRGYVSRASHTKKRGAEQFFFANERFMRHPYFHRMVINGYGNMITKGDQPEYFLYLTVDPSEIDVNISPTKTEIKFSKEPDIGSLIYSAVRQAVMQGNAMPSLEFTDHPEEQLDIPIAQVKDPALIGEPPVVSPFREMPSKINVPTQSPRTTTSEIPDLSGWEEYNSTFETHRSLNTPKLQRLDGEFEVVSSSLNSYPTFPEPLLMNPYAFTLYEGRVCMVHIPRAQFQIAFYALRKALQSGETVSYPLLFPALVELGVRERTLLKEYYGTITRMGFDLSALGASTYSVNAVPNGTPAGSEEELLLSLIEECAVFGKESIDLLIEKLAQKVAGHRVRPHEFPAGSRMAHELLVQLFQLPEYLVTANGKTIVSFISPKDLQTRFK